MWPFDAIAKRKYSRRYKAALVVYLGAHLFESLTPEQRANVEREVDFNFNQTDTPAVASRKGWDQDDMAAHRAAAMDRLGFELGLAQLSWAQLFEPWSYWRNIWYFPQRFYDCRADVLISDYRYFDPATEDAKRFVQANCFALHGGGSS